MLRGVNIKKKEKYSYQKGQDLGRTKLNPIGRVPRMKYSFISRGMSVRIK